MKKLIFLSTIIFCILGGASQTSAQEVRLGVTFAPSISFNQVNFTPNAGSNLSPNIESGSGGMRFIFGLVSDFNLKDEKYYFSTGLVYNTKKVGVTGTVDGLLDPQYNLQYLQIPVTLKLFTNEVVPSGWIFFQMGGGLEVKISEKNKTENNTTNEDPLDFQVIDIPLILAVGMEFDLGENILYGSLGYQRGLINSAKKIDGGKLIIRNQLVTFNVGFFF